MISMGRDISKVPFVNNIERFYFGITKNMLHICTYVHCICIYPQSCCFFDTMQKKLEQNINIPKTH